MGMRQRGSLSLLAAVLLGCGQDGVAPSVTLVAPANDAAVSGTTAAQATLADEGAQAEVSIFARTRGGKEDGLRLGAVNTPPYVISWNSTRLPNGDALELYAKAKAGGGTSTSPPVRVTINNASAPRLLYLVAYNLPAGLSEQSLHSPRTGGIGKWPQIDPLALRSGPGASLTAQSSPAGLGGTTPDRSLAVEWAWKPVAGAAGYRIMLSRSGAAGPYEVVVNQAASSGAAAEEKFSEVLTDAPAVGAQVYGTLRSLAGNGTESATANAGKAVFLDAQEVASPVPGQVKLKQL